jgi:uncharacterized protein
MMLTNEFLVEAPVDRVWGLLDELESVVACMPGAAYIGRDGDNNKVSMKVKVGAISSHFQGTVRFVEKNESTHTAVIRGNGKDVGGKASATATIIAKLEPLPSTRTKVLVETDLVLTGRLAQFGGGVIADIASRMIAQFTANLHRAVIAGSSVTDSHSSAMARDRDITANTEAIATKEPAPLDLGTVIGAIALRRALRYVAMPVGFFVVGWLIGKFF